MSAAIFLAAEGWTVRLHEQAAEIDEIGAGILLKPNSLRALDSVGVVERLFAAQPPAPIEFLTVRDGRGKVRATYEHSGERIQYCPLRREVITALKATAEAYGVEIATNSRIVSADGTGSLTDSAGRSFTADLVVGADGWRSAVRNSVGIAARARALDYGAIRVVVPRAASDSQNALETYWSGDRVIGTNPVNPNLLYVFLSCRDDDRRALADPFDVDDWAKRFPGLDRGLFERIAVADRIWHPYCHVKTSTWSKGHAAIVGDAANALPPTLAQGAGLAIMNGAGLAKEVSATDDVPAALARWERRYRPITRSTQRWAMARLWATKGSIARWDGLRAQVMAVTRWPSVINRMYVADMVMSSPQGPVPI
jgi:2-polyprenyl-6-methoxyphenol hydroxylase-like FAD-dependent oxidoreductase